ncbi:hypothetical protein EV360DRAFT_83654 [Lentinula raphanica]|nr:hypothetical protein EV360DRAFT_83654 [Lentinula raphanica]
MLIPLDALPSMMSMSQKISDISDPSPALAHYTKLLSPNPDVQQHLLQVILTSMEEQVKTIKGIIDTVPVVNENDVQFAERLIACISNNLAVPSMLNLTDKQLQNFGSWMVFNTYSSTEKESKTDLLWGFADKDLIVDQDLHNKHHSEIGRVLALVLQDDLSNPALNPDTTQRRHKPIKTSAFYDIVQPLMQQLLHSLKESQVIDVLTQYYQEVDKKKKGDDSLLNIIMSWVNVVRNMLVQISSQLIRHNLTFGIITCYDHSFILHRVRSTGQLRMSRLQEVWQSGHILERTILLIDACNDCQERFKADEVQWADPYKATKSTGVPDPAISSAQEGDDPKHDRDYEPTSSEDDALDKSAQASKRRHRKTQKGISPGHRGDPPPPPPPGGGTGGSGSSGSGGGSQSKGGNSTGKRTTSSGITQSSSDNTSTGREAKRARKRSAGIPIDLKQIHLAFNCTEPLLLSSTFSSYHRVSVIKTEPTPAPSSPITPPQHTTTLPANQHSFYSQEPTPGILAAHYTISSSPVTPPQCTAALPATQHSSGSHGILQVEQLSPAYSTASSTDPGLTDSRTSDSDSVFSSGGSWNSSGGIALLPASSPTVNHKGRTSVGNAPVSTASVTPVQDMTISSVSTATKPVQRSQTNTVVNDGGIFLEKLLMESKEMGWTLWKGYLVLEGPAIDENADHIQIVVKVSDWEQESSEVGTVSDAGKGLLLEAKCYEVLANHGITSELDMIPQYYGIFDYCGSIALIIEDDGKQLPKSSLPTLDISEKHQLFEKAKALHDLGIIHGDLSEQNILKNNNGDFCFINF